MLTIRGWAVAGYDATLMGYSPYFSTRQLCDQLGLDAKAIDMVHRLGLTLGDVIHEDAPGIQPDLFADPDRLADERRRQEAISAVKKKFGKNALLKGIDLLPGATARERNMLSVVDLIVVVLIVSAAALAFIVLYNLTNINVEERVREIASLKVLGFTRREVYAYVFREIALLAVIGDALGLVLGVFLERFVVTTAEVDYVMFGRMIHPASFAYAFVLTLAFAVLVILSMRGAQLDVPIATELVSAGLGKGIILNHIGDSVLRFLPPLVITRHQVDTVCDRLTDLIGELA